MVVVVDKTLGIYKKLHLLLCIMYYYYCEFKTFIFCHHNWNYFNLKILTILQKKKNYNH